MSDLGYHHGLSGSACPTRIGNAVYLEAFLRGHAIWAAAHQVQS